MLEQEAQQRVALGPAQADDLRGVAAIDEQRLAAAVGMRDHQRMDGGLGATTSPLPVNSRSKLVPPALAMACTAFSPVEHALQGRRQRLPRLVEVGEHGVAADRWISMP
jgi:hypothetical protein